jgi:hypothetical protein
MTTLYLSGLAFAVIALLIWALRRDATAKGKAEVTADIAKATAEKVIDHAEKSGELRTDSDVVVSLRTKAAAKRGDTSK